MRIEIHDPSPDWPTRFSEIGERLRAAFGEYALRIDHIGSTSVPGLGAKDIIDVQVTVADFDDAAIRSAVAAAGLNMRDDIMGDHLPPGSSIEPSELEKRYAQAERINCHIRRTGTFNQRYALLFRDYLREHPSSAAAYEAIKRQLARHFADDVEGYYDVKDPVFDLIMESANQWAEITSWEPGPTDA